MSIENERNEQKPSPWDGATVFIGEPETSPEEEATPEETQDVENSTEAGEASDSPESGQFITIDDEQIPVEQAREWLSKGKDATKKWQEAAELKREAEAQMQEINYVREMETLWNAGPEGQIQLINALSAMAGIQPPTQSNGQQPYGQFPSINMEDMSDEGKWLAAEKARLENEVSALKQQNAKVISALNKMEGYMSSQSQVSEARQVAKQIKTDFGIDVNPEDLLRSREATGISDLYGAWMKENRSNLAKGIAPRVEKKPSAPPSGQNRTFDINAPGMTADKIADMLRRGYVPK